MHKTWFIFIILAKLLLDIYTSGNKIIAFKKFIDVSGKYSALKKFALLNKKLKSVVIKTKDRKKYYLCAKIDDDSLPYQNENFARFIDKYSK